MGRLRQPAKPCPVHLLLCLQGPSHPPYTPYPYAVPPAQPVRVCSCHRLTIGLQRTPSLEQHLQVPALDPWGQPQQPAPPYGANIYGARHFRNRNGIPCMHAASSSPGWMEGPYLNLLSAPPSFPSWAKGSASVLEG